MSSRTLLALALAAVLAQPALASEKKVKKAEVPKAVMDAAAQQYPKAKMTGFSKGDEHGGVVYEIKLEEGTARSEIVVTPEGKILSEEKTLSEKQLPAEVRKALAASPHAKAKVVGVEEVKSTDKPDTPTYEVTVSEGKKTVALTYSAKGELIQSPAH